MSFMGYIRPDGTVGVRNHVLVIPTVACVNRVATEVARQTGAVTMQHPYGCTFDTEENNLTEQVFASFGRHPNVGAALVISLGCETVAARRVAQEIAQSGKPVELLIVQGEGGAWKTVEKAAEKVRALQADLARQQREEFGLEHLVVAMECGGSDGFSGLSANPAVGVCADLVVSAGGTVYLSEIPEMVGAEQVLARRCADDDVRERLLRLVAQWERELSLMSPDGSGSYLAPGNIAGGLTTIAEKSLGCIKKAGTSPIVDVVEYGRRSSRRGLVIMDTPGFDLASVTGKVAGGAQVVLFTTGRGTPTGSPIAPVIKVASNTAVFERLQGDIDLNAGTIVDGVESIPDAGARIFAHLLKVASGEKGRAEFWPTQEFALPNVSVLRKEIVCHSDYVLG